MLALLYLIKHLGMKKGLKMKLLVYGEVLFDIYPDNDYIGGAPFNFYAHSSLEGTDACLLTAVGDDDLGNKALEAIKSYNGNTKYVLKNDKRTGMVTVVLDENKVPSYNIHTDTAYDNIVLSDEMISEISNEGFDCLYFGTLIQRNCTSSASLKRLISNINFKDVFCDVNLRRDCYDKESIEFCLNNATILKISDEEEPVLRQLGTYTVDDCGIEDIARAISKKYKNLRVIIITLGAKGAYAYDCINKKSFYCDPVACMVVSTVGAGDSFGAAFLSAYEKGENIQTCLKKGAELSSFVVSRAEAVPNR